jgi:hypothetical protein
MRKAILTGVILGLAMAGRAAAEEGHAHQHEHASGAQTVSGEVVDLACYLSEGALGPGHKECAQKCITSGLPVGIKSGDKIYLAVGSEHGSANSALAPLAAQQVTVEGTVTERDGVHLIAIKKVTAKES